MGYLINEASFINNNIFKYEERMNSQYARFLEKSPTFVTYFQIDNIDSTADNGFQSVERIIGPNSPVRFKKIVDFPVYGIDSINLNLSDEEQGLDSTYDGELIILPNTIKPLPNDCFTVVYLNTNYLFMVTDVAYDTIKSNNYYKISFTVRSLTEDIKTALERQINENYNCILTNIGTEDKCLIRQDHFEQIIELNKAYTDICEKYKTIFYNKKFNSFIFTDVNEYFIYDKFLNIFINRNRLFNEKYNYETFMTTDEDRYPLTDLHYEKSFYRTVEKQNLNKVNNINFITVGINDLSSVFQYWCVQNVKSIRFSDSGGSAYIPSELIEKIKTCTLDENDNIIENLLIQFFNNKITSIHAIDQVKLLDYDYLDFNMESFIMVPILLFILRFYVNNFLSTK